MNRKHKPTSWLRAKVGLAALGSLLVSHQAKADVTIAKGDTWDAYVAGRVGVFASYARGEARPLPNIAGSTVEPGGGIADDDPPVDTIYDQYDAMNMPARDMAGNLTTKGHFEKLRVRSGFYPNILTIGVHKRFGEQLKLTAQVSLWGTIEPVYAKDLMPPNRNRANGGRENSVEADFREGFLRLEGRWGQLDGGRFLTIFGRGLTEIDVLYGHGYGVGFPMTSKNQSAPVLGNLRYPGPTSGMTGFGVLAATHSAGLTYTSPDLSGIKVKLGVFDPASYTTAGWGKTKAPRPEAEVSYDLRKEGVAVHVFGSAAWQQVLTLTQKESVWGASAGGRLELGPVRLGVGGFMGKAPGIDYAFDDNSSLSSTTAQRTITNPDGSVSMERSYALRNTRGFVGMVQVALGQVDVSAGAGQTVVLQLDADKANAAMVSTLKSQTGITGAVVYHVNESLHFDVDFINGTYKWYNGESEALNVINGGATVTF